MFPAIPSFFAGMTRRTEDAMKPFARLVPTVVGLALLLTITPSWGQPTCNLPGCNPTASDAKFNTAGGTHALEIVSGMFGGFSNTAFGHSALAISTEGTANTAIGAGALGSNSTGVGNTATGAVALGANKGSYNTAIGGGTLLNNAAGSFNSAIGADA